MSLSTGLEAESSQSLDCVPPCRQLTISEIQVATENFDESLVIGHGGFGKVYRGTVTNGESLLDVAVKRLESTSNQGAAEFWAEVEMLSKLRHCNLVSLIGYCNDGNEMILVYEYMPKGTLSFRLHECRSPLTWVRRLEIAIGAARGLEYLHTGTGIRQGVVHRDVKSSNVLLDGNWASKVSDFGLSTIVPTNQPFTYVKTVVKGTFGYLDPNYFQTSRLTRKSDVYAFGVILFELLSGRKALDTSLEEEEMGLATWAQDSIKEGRLKQVVDSNLRGAISSKCMKEFAVLANRCLDINPKKRPTMAEVVAGLESILTLHYKTNGILLLMDKKIFGIKVPAFRLPSSHEKSVVGRSLKSMESYRHTIGGENQILRQFDFKTISNATENFSRSNMIGLKGFKLYKESEKNCYMLGAKELAIAWGNDTRYWDWRHVAESRFAEVAILREVWWLDIHGKLPSVLLSPRTTYAAYLVFKINEDSWGLSGPGKTIVSLDGVRNETSNVCLQVQQRPRVMWERKTALALPHAQTHAHIHTSRNDGWMEIKLGEFYYHDGDEGEVEMAFQEHDDYRSKGGLIVEGIEIRPK